MKRTEQLILAASLVCLNIAWGEPPTNLALNRPYTLNHAPNYQYSTDPGDRVQLTNGVESQGYFWTRKETVGWRHVNPVVITIDLGKRYPISGVSFRTGFGRAGVYPPEAIFLFVSNDKKIFYPAGELITLSEKKKGRLDEKSYQVHKYQTQTLKCAGRYVTLGVIPRGAYTFCDEIEVFRGKQEFLSERPGNKIHDITRWIRKQKTLWSIRARFQLDLRTIVANCEKALPQDQAHALKKKAEKFSSRIINEVTTIPKGFRAVVPYSQLHREIIALNGEVLRATGLKGLVPWHTNRYAPILPFDPPPEKANPALTVFLMRGEYRADVLNLTNATSSDLSLKVSFSGLRGSPLPPWITVHRVEFVDTVSHRYVADALPLAPKQDNAYSITAPQGMTTQVWFTFHPKDVPVGNYSGKIHVRYSKGECVVPITVDISRLRFPKDPHLSLGLWDYTNDEPSYDVTRKNRKALIRNMRDHFVDSPWAQRSVLPWPPKESFNQHNELVKPLDFSVLNRWVANWPNARTYLIFLSVGSGSFAGADCGDANFSPRVAAWMKAIEKNITSLGLKAGQFGFLIIDEPHNKKQGEIILSWSRAIKSGCTDFVIWEDPTYREPEKQGIDEMFHASDVLCPNLNIFGSGTKKSQSFYLDLVKDNARRLWFYQCSGPVRLLDPYYYYRLQPWFCWKFGAVGCGFWAYADSSKSSWNVYAAANTIYSPVYIDSKTVVDGKHFEALREGIEDYEYLYLLKKKTYKDKSFPLALKVQRLFTRAVKEVVPKFNSRDTWWKTEKNYDKADSLRLDIFKILSR